MAFINYDFEKIQNYIGINYIFQLISNRKLSAIYHSHNFYEIIYFLQGKATHLINEKTHICVANQMILLRPSDRHCFIKQSDDVALFSLSVQKEEFESVANIYGSDFFKQISSSESPLFYHNCSLLNYSFLDYENMSVNIKTYDYKFLLSCILHFCIQQNMSKSIIPVSLSFAINEIKKTENLKIGIEALIKLSNYSHTHLARLMKEYYNTTPKHYINELRLQKAYDCIILTQTPINQIAEDLGFNSYSHFNKIFTKRFNVTPSSLRKDKKIWTI